MEPNHSSSGRSFLLLLILFTLHLSSSTARYTITPSQPLASNETLVSASGVFALGFFTPPSSDNQYVGLWYNQISDHSILWVANRQNPVTNSTTAVLSLTPDGRLTITGLNSTVIVWSSTNITTALTSPVAELLDNGNLVVKQDGDENSNNYAWQGFDHLTDTLLPGMKLGVDLTTGLNRTLVAWTSPSDPSPGPYYAYMETSGDPEAYFMRGSTLIWRTGAWDGTHFSGIPDMSTYNGFSFSFVNNASEVTYSYHISNQSLVSRLLVNSTGYVQRTLWLWDRNMWNFFLTVPKDQCDQMGACGAYGLCDSNNSPMCSCLQGFKKKNPVNWNLWDWRDGCTRQTPLDCKNGSGTDGFVPVSNVRLPQSANATVDMTLSLDECRTLCLKNCSCTAYADANISDDRSGCVMWVGQLLDIRNYVGFGQDLYVRLAAADLGLASGHSHKKKMTVAIVVSFILVIFLLACVCCFLWGKKKSTVVNRLNLLLVMLLFACVGWFQWKRMKRRGDSTLFSDQSSKEAEKNDLDLPLFGFGTIAAATDYFAAENRLGEGGFGPVYKGKLGESQEIAVKRLAKTSQQGTNEFKNEVMLIAKLQHRNLVRLLGYCIQGVERMLIYEYMPNKSLDAFLFDEEKSALLDWKTRYQIIIGITRGLLYLHHDSRFRIIHRDLKASNILLDKEMTPKISDFGMARIFGGDETDFNTRKVVGTYGYMSPEYAMAGIFSMKSDVFSFGVLVLEIISGRKNRGAYSFPPHLNLVAHVWSLWNEGKSLQIVHESMNDSFPPEEILKCIKVGLLCVQERPEDRPLMSSVVVMLGSASDIASLPQPNKPGFIASTDPPETHPPPSKKQESCTLNDITISLDGR